MEFLAFFLHLILFYFCDARKYKAGSKIVENKASAQFDNPNFVRDRFKTEILKPQMPELFKERNRKPFNPAWMDYCDPYHCNDYHRTACGLNRDNMRFKWFQSVCHVVLNNQCSTYRGSLKYDLVDTKFCTVYVMYLRIGCPSICDDKVDPVCAVSSVNNKVMLFKNRCAMEMANCHKYLQEYEEVKMSVCEYYVFNTEST